MSDYQLDYRVRAAKALGLRGFATGNHTIEVNPGIFQPIHVNRLWVAKFDSGFWQGIVIVAHTEIDCRGIYLPATRIGREEPPVKPVIFQDWTDPVIGALKSINLIPVSDDMWWGDGFSFDLDLITFGGLNTHIHFSNNIHFDPSMEWLWDSITDTAVRILHSYDETTQQLIQSLDDDDFTITGDYFKE